MGTASHNSSQRASSNVPVRQTPKKNALPCGARTCLHCHRGCGVETAAYILRGLDDLGEAAEAKDDE